jgi:DNA-binding GntR family transcriptional regulator
MESPLMPEILKDADHETDGATVSTSDRIVRHILKGLYEGRYVAGQRLVEPDMVSRYNVSRSTVREAIKRLAAQGVVETHHNRGARIRQLSKQEARNILLITEVIVGLAARLAAEHISRPGSHDLFSRTLDELLAAANQADRYEFVRMRNRFHRTMARIAENPELEQMLANMQVHLVRNRLVMRPEERVQSYQAIGTAILAGDADLAEKNARTHVRRMIDLLDDVYEPSFIGADDDK